MPQQTVAVPKTGRELQALIARRDALREQLQSIRDERNGLAQQRLNAEARVEALGGRGNAQDRQMVRELEARIDRLGSRINAIESEMDHADDAITQARANGVTGGDVINVPAIPNPPSPVITFPSMFNRGNEALLRSKYETALIAEGAVLVLLAIVACRVVWVAAKRKFLRGVGASADLLGLRQSVDAIAVEVERISENQRYVTKLLTDRGQRPAERIEPPVKETLKRL